MWRKIQNSNDVKPAEIDKTSSSAVVYVRKDFKKVQITDQMTETKRTVWEYMENEIPVDDWSVYEGIMETHIKTDANTANIDYIAMMSDIELPEEV